MDFDDDDEIIYPRQMSLLFCETLAMYKSKLKLYLPYPLVYSPTLE